MESNDEQRKADAFPRLEDEDEAGYNARLKHSLTSIIQWSDLSIGQ
jgi:hypothetical protein